MGVSVCVCGINQALHSSPTQTLYSLIPCHIPSAGQKCIHAQIDRNNVRLVVHVAGEDTQHTRSDAHNDAARTIHVVYPTSHRFPIAGDHCGERERERASDTLQGRQRKSFDLLPDLPMPGRKIVTGNFCACCCTTSSASTLV